VNIPTQAKIRLEWATRRIANSEVKRFGMEMAQCFPAQENVGGCADISAHGDACRTNYGRQAKSGLRSQTTN